jgi:crotonobetainyl-CoA:carnitine CoA-transferase CaiB-like acyl-CoA transferase
MAHPVIGNYTMSGWPVRFGDAPPAVGPAPLLGQHSGDVLADWLKDGRCSDRHIARGQGDSR